MSTSTTVLTDAKRPVRPRTVEGGDPRTTSREADARLIAAFLLREPGAAEALYDRYAARIYGLGLVLLKHRADAEDLVQDTFLKLWRAGAAFDPGRASLDVWILLTARSRAIDVLRRRAVETRTLSSLPGSADSPEEPGPEAHAEQQDLIERVFEAMRRLPPQQRSAVALAYLGERSSTDVAESQNTPRGTAKSRIRAGIATLRRTLREEPPGGPPTGRRDRANRLGREAS